MLIGGYFVKNDNDKEELLELLVNLMSSRGRVVVLSELKRLTIDELKNKIGNIDNRYNGVVTVFDLVQNKQTYKCIISQDKRVVELDNGTTLIIEYSEEFIADCEERRYEGNKLSEQEKRILKQIS